jgi:hypothetical protein
MYPPIYFLSLDVIKEFRAKRHYKQVLTTSGGILIMM